MFSVSRVRAYERMLSEYGDEIATGILTLQDPSLRKCFGDALLGGDRFLEKKTQPARSGVSEGDDTSVQQKRGSRENGVRVWFVLQVAELKTHRGE